MYENSVEVVNLSKKYRIYSRPIHRLIEWLTPGGKAWHKEFPALRRVSFLIPRGDAIGIIGPNGAGKSTLLKIISGTTKPTEGSIKVNGRVAALLELGMGFHPEFTGRQNIRMNGRLLGLEEEELEEKIPRIISFSELGDFIDRPVRTYSSGMYVRLGFSVAASVEPDILIIDEALSVGDLHFQQKCIRHIKKIHERGATLLFVSHDPGTVKNLCSEAVLLDEGEIVSRGDPDEIIDFYNAMMAKKNIRGSAFSIERVPSRIPGSAVQHSGNFMAVVVEAGLLNENGEPVTAVVSGENASIYVRVFFLQDVSEPTIGFLIKDRLGNEIFGTNTWMLHQKMGDYKAGDALEAKFAMDLNIGAGEYSLTVAAHTRDMHIYECFDWADKVFLFTVAPSSDFQFTGVCRCLPTVSQQKMTIPKHEARNLVNEIFRDAPEELNMGPDEQKFLSKGWYDSEPSEQGYVRWTEGEFSFFLRPTGERLFLEISCPRPDIESRPVKGKIKMEGRELGNLLLDKPDSFTFQYTITPEKDSEPALFSIFLDHTWSPAEALRSGDSRSLGVLVNRIWQE